MWMNGNLHWFCVTNPPVWKLLGSGWSQDGALQIALGRILHTGLNLSWLIQLSSSTISRASWFMLLPSVKWLPKSLIHIWWSWLKKHLQIKRIWELLWSWMRDGTLPVQSWMYVSLVLRGTSKVERTKKEDWGRQWWNQTHDPCSGPHNLTNLVCSCCLSIAHCWERVVGLLYCV